MQVDESFVKLLNEAQYISKCVISICPLKTLTQNNLTFLDADKYLSTLYISILMNEYCSWSHCQNVMTTFSYFAQLTSDSSASFFPRHLLMIPLFGASCCLVIYDKRDTFLKKKIIAILDNQNHLHDKLCYEPVPKH